MSIAKGKRTEGSPSLSKTKFRFDLSQLEKLKCFTQQKAEKKRIGRIKSTANGLGRSETETEVNGEGIETEGRNRRASQRGLERKEEQSCSPDPSKTLMNEVIYKIETEGVKAEWKQDEREDCIAESQPIERDHHIWRTTTTLPIIQQTQKSFLSTQGGTHPNTPTHHHYPQPQSQSQSQSPYLLLPPQHQYPPDCYYKTQLTKRIFQITYQQISRDPRTTVMIKNIPNKYSLKLLSDQIDSKHSYTYDFLYLPFDFDNNCNVGYAFINFLSLEFLKKFYEEFQNRRWMRFRSVKICVLTYARLQGRNSLIEHFHNSKVLNQKEKRYRPIIKMGGLEEMLEMQRRGQSSGGQQATQFTVPRQEPPPTTTPLPPTP